MSARNDRMPRGSSPPLLTLKDAFRLASAIWEHGSGRCSLDEMSKLTGNSTSSSSFVRKINALKSYGLIESNKSEVTLTALGRDLVTPISESVEAEARKQSFLNIDVYSKIYDRHKGKLLPADEFLRNIIEHDGGIPRELADAWVDHFKDAASSAGLLFERPDGKFQIMEVVSLPMRSDHPVIGPQPTAEPQPLARVSEERSNHQSTDDGTPGHTTRIELSGKRFAFFKFPDFLTPRDAQKLKGALSGLIAIIDSMVESDPNPPTSGI